MSLTVRPARLEDHAAIAGFASQTFEWGDYVPDAFPGWLADPSAMVVVAADGDRAVALARGVLLSPEEGWLHGARVHPDYRRQGIASRLNDHLCEWAAERGAKIVRLLIESWNEPAQRQVEASGYRMAGEWVSARRTLGTEPDPQTNGGRRVPGDEQMTAATRAEIEPAWVTWSTSELSRVGRTLYPMGWLMRRMTRHDLDDAVRRHALLHAPSGWAVADPSDADGMFVPFVAATEEDAYRLVKALVDRADRKGFERMRMMVPAVGWMVDALTRGGFELAPNQVWARTVG